MTAELETRWDVDVAGPGTETIWDRDVAGPGTRTRWDLRPALVELVVGVHRAARRAIMRRARPRIIRHPKPSRQEPSP